jgi:hypothetical protein
MKIQDFQAFEFAEQPQLWQKYDKLEESDEHPDDSPSRSALLVVKTMISDNEWRESVLIQSPHLRLTRFVVPTRRALISPLRERLLRAIRDFQVAGTGRENHFCMALEEALNNAFYHGNLEISSELKEDGGSAFLDLAREREHQDPWSSRHVTVTELVGLFGLWISIEDEGGGFNVEAAFERCNDPELMLSSGRGLLLMKGFSDELFFNNRGNEVTLVLYPEDQSRNLPLQAIPETGELRRLIAS